MLLSEGQMSDYKGAALMFDALPKARAMIADKPALSLSKGAMTATGSARRSPRAARRLASHQNLLAPRAATTEVSRPSALSYVVPTYLWYLRHAPPRPCRA
jgi:hypothetical protein